jgi:hypothetical protein
MTMHTPTSSVDHLTEISQEVDTRLEKRILDVLFTNSYDNNKKWFELFSVFGFILLVLVSYLRSSNCLYCSRRVARAKANQVTILVSPLPNTDALKERPVWRRFFLKVLNTMLWCLAVPWKTQCYN